MESEVKYWYLRDHKLFGALNNSEIRQLCIITGFKKAKKGEIIYFSSSDEPRIFFLKKGNIKIVEIDDQGNEIIKDIIRKGDLFGELGFDTDNKGNEYAKVLTDDVTVCSFLLSDFEKVMMQHPQLALSYTKFVGFQLKRIRNSYSNLVFKDAKKRLTAFLKSWAASEGIKNKSTVILKNYLTQQDIAQVICTSRQTSVQLLNDLQEAGLIQYGRREIVIHDINALD